MIQLDAYIAELLDGCVDVVNRDALKPYIRPTADVDAVQAFRLERAALRDIQHHIDLATGLVAGLSFEVFRDDIRTLYAVTRCLEDHFRSV